MNVIKINVNFKNRTIYKSGVDLTSGDYNTTKLIFDFDRKDGRKVFEMKDEDGNLVLITDIVNNEVELVGKDENGNNASLFKQKGKYIFEISLYDGDSKLTSAFDFIKVKQEQVEIDGEVITPYLPVFDELVNDVEKMKNTIKTDGTGNKYLSDDGTYKYVQGGGTEGGTSNYEELNNLPSINGVELKGDLTTEDLGIEVGDSSNVVDEILEFSQTAIPKTFNLEVGYMNSTGEELDNSNYYRSDFIKIDTAFKYYLLVNNITNTSQTFCYYLYDENKSLIQTRITIPVEAQTLKKQRIYPSSGTKYARILITKGLKDCLVRVYADENIEHATKKELRKATYGSPRIVDIEDYYRPIEENLLEYFGPNKKVVLVGDSFTQGLGSTELINYNTIDGDGDSVSIIGNGYDYGVMHNLPNYESGVKLYKSGSRVWHEAIDGNGYGQRLKNYLQNKFGCSVNNYAMSGITSATLLSKTMNSENSDLATSGSSIKNIFDTQDDWEIGSIGSDGSLVNSTGVIRTKTYIELSSYSGDVTITTSDTNIPFKVFYYDDNGFKENSSWIRSNLIVDKTKGTKILILGYTADLTKFSTITITAEDSGNIQVIEGVTNGFDTVFLTIGGNDRGFADYVSPSTGETITGKEQHRYNLKKLVEYILGKGKKLILMSMTPCEDDPEKNVPMWDIDEVIGEVAEEYNLPFVSNYQGMTKYCETTGIDIKTLRNIDGLHPTDEGYAVVEALVCRALGINEVDKKYVDNLVGDIETLLGGI